MSILAKPFGLLLLWLYNLVGNYGLAIILFALLVKLILLPFMMKSKRGTLKMARLNPQVKELEKKHGGNQQKYNAEVQKLYRSYGVNPMSGCIWSLIPWPIMIALYYAIRLPLTVMMGVDKALIAEGGAIYNALQSLGFDFGSVRSIYLEIAESQFISQAENWPVFSALSDKLCQLNYNFLGLDLGTTPSWRVWEYPWSDMQALMPQLVMLLVPLLAGLLTWLTSEVNKRINPQTNENEAANSMMMFMPLMTIWFCFIMPAALGLYWIASSGFGIVQDVLLTKYYNHKLDIEDADRIEQEIAREAELAEKRRATAILKAENATTVNENTSKRKQQKQQKQERTEKAAEWERRNAGETAEEPSRVGERRYARGRAYDPDRYARPADENETAATETAEAYSENDQETAEAVNEAIPETTSGDKEQT